MRKPLHVAALAGAALLLVAGAAAVLLGLGVLRPAPPVLTPRAATVTHTSVQGLAMRFELTARNPNRIALRLQRITVRVRVAGTDLGTTTIDRATTLPAHQTVPVQAALTVGWTDLPRLVLASSTTPEVPYELEGRAAVGGTRLHVEVPFRMTGTFPRRILLEAAGPLVPGVGDLLRALPGL